MDNIIYLTQEIDNTPFFSEAGAIDKIEKEIRAVGDGEELTVIISSPGGVIFDGFRIARALSEHIGKTKAIVTGLAASMAALLLAFFDEVEADSNAMIMLHKAKITGKPIEELTPDEKMLLENFNNKASSKLQDKGVDIALIDKVFGKDSTKDIWLTPMEAKAANLINEVTTVTRSNGMPTITRVAATYEESARVFYETYNNKVMGLFGKKEKSIVTRQAEMKDGGILVFNSAKETLSKGDKVAKIGSNESLKGEIVLKDNTKIVLNADNEVESVEPINEGDLTPEEMMAKVDEMALAIGDHEDRIKAIEDGAAAQVEEVENKVNEVVEAVEAVVKSIGLEAVTNFKLPKVEGKTEPVLSGLSDSVQRMVDLKSVVLNGKQETK